ncbi:spermatogenesis-associated serine-rich protein 1 isoform X3 [Danio rerio]|uniref:Spermatogenesis-associated serine-rich protein 1 isoform X3 n=1 Tax=Danio rerio TaxID=7955 RepID=A0A8M9P303_DANRE
MDKRKPTESESFWSFGKERDFKPHITHIEPVLTECDLDWKSHLRWIPEPRYSDAPFPHIKDIKFPSERKLMRSFPLTDKYSNYPSRKVRPFLVPEYSPDFHKCESAAWCTTNYGSSSCGALKSLIHLKPPTKYKRPPNAENHKGCVREEDILEVKSLNSWRPAPDIYDRTVPQDM